MPRWRILIVDDEADIRTIVRANLATKYEVVEAVDGLDALEKLELCEPDFAILDVMMPLMDGFRTCEAIRRHPRFRRIPVLFLSALNTKDDMKKGYSAGANLYLTKPFDPARLLRNVDLTFETNPPPPSRKRYTIEELNELIKKGVDALANAHADTNPAIHEEEEPEPEAPTELKPQEADKAPAWYEGRRIVYTGEPLPDPRKERPVGIGPPRPRLLVVDDEQSIVTVVHGYLDDFYEVISASDGLDGIEKVTAYQPDIILLDAMMPKMSGYQLCQSLRRNARFAKTPILFMSAKTGPREKDYALRIGGSAFLPKPFDRAGLETELKKLEAQPGFRIQPKAVTYLEIQQAENRKKKKLEDQEDRLHRKQETELEKFLREQTQQT